jgi:hypothetical protein
MWPCGTFRASSDEAGRSDAFWLKFQRCSKRKGRVWAFAAPRTPSTLSRASSLRTEDIWLLSVVVVGWNSRLKGGTYGRVHDGRWRDVCAFTERIQRDLRGRCLFFCCVPKNSDKLLSSSCLLKRRLCASRQMLGRHLFCINNRAR